jgi:hypothetical protein
MADFAQMIYGTAEDVAKGGMGDLVGQYSRGAALAEQAEAVQQKRAQVAQKKQELEMQMDEKLFTAFEAGSKMGQKEQASFFSKDGYFRQMRDSMGRTQAFPDDKIDWITKTPDNIAKARTVVADYRAGKITADTMYATIYDPVNYPDIALYRDEIGKEAGEAVKDYMSQQAQEKQARIAAGAKATEKATERASVGETTVTKKLGEEFASYVGEGGQASIKSNYNKLNEAANQLQSGKLETGSTWLKIIGGSDTAVDITDPKVAAARDNIQSAIVGTLRPVLGGQFAQKEGEKILNLSFNPRLSSAENAKRVASELTKIKSMVIAKEDQFVKQGFMTDEERTFSKNEKAPPAAGNTITLKNGQVKDRAAVMKKYEDTKAALANNPNDPSLQKLVKAQEFQMGIGE